MNQTLGKNQTVTEASDLGSAAVELASKILTRSGEIESPAEAKSAQKIAKLIEDPEGKELTFLLTDQVIRPTDTSRSAALFRSLIKRFGAPVSLSPLDRFLMKLGATASYFAPSIVMPAVIQRLRNESSDVILPAERTLLTSHIERRRKTGASINLNLLGEAVLGEGEANHRLDLNLEALKSGTISYLSVKLSSIFSQINLTAFDATQDIAAERLRDLYRAALTQSPPAFVNLDMEEYKDLHLTLDLFKRVLMEPEFLTLRAGIVLQAYLPDTYPLQVDLTAWAQQRMAMGGASIKVRLVKGANLAMEKVDATLHHWEQAPYHTKSEVDANFLRMLDFGCQPENAQAVNLGVATHNLFNIAYALVLRKSQGVTEFVELEMLEGMAPPQARATLEEAGSLVLYAPVVEKDDFNAAIAYLIRRLDENTTPGNFLHDLFDIAPGTPAWSRQREAFLTAYEQRLAPSLGPNRRQDRSSETYTPQTDAFSNVADTDFSLPGNRQWLADTLNKRAETLPEFDAPSEADIENVLGTAATSQWPKTPIAERSKLLLQAGVELSRSRQELIAVMNVEANKSPVEADVEISEAIDFANYYAHSFTAPAWTDGISPAPLGPAVVVPPWNFPCAIPCGGILASLIAGNPVIIKPSPETRHTAHLMVECLWRAGIPRDALQFVPAPDNHLGQRLITDSRVHSVILTGSTQTSDLFLSWRPDLLLSAETSGKNAMIITATADPDLAIKDLARSAFNHSGQKCSAASIALIENTLLDDKSFLTRLKDAASSLPVGLSTDTSSVVTPLIQKPSDDLYRALTKLDSGESWLLEPSQPDPENPALWSPGIRIGVQANSWIHRTELFGPVLAIIGFDSLEDAISIQNSSEFALTGGIHSLDPDEVELWKSKVEIGNAYINRPITGAIVQRQPFGGWKRSSIGAGAKAGGPNYVSQFVQLESKELPALAAPLSSRVAELLKLSLKHLPEAQHQGVTAATHNAAYWLEHEFSQEHDPSDLAPESNILRYRPVPGATLRIVESLTLNDAVICSLMAATAGTALTWSAAADLDESWQSTAKDLGLPILIENDDQVRQRMAATPCSTLRSPGQNAISIHPRNHAAPVTVHARLELLPYYLEQTLSETQHRHGRLLAPAAATN